MSVGRKKRRADVGGLAAAAWALLASPAAAADAEAKLDLAQLTLAPISVSEITTDGRTYSVFVTRPPKAPPPGGFPLLVVLDANSNFATAANSAWARSAFSDMAPIVVVGIGYPTRNPMEVQSRRSFDFTASKPEHEPSPDLAGKPLGGGAAFRDNVVAAVLARMDREEQVNPRCHVVLGHSLGGLFVVDTLLNHPTMFEGYFAASPSLWFNDFELLSKVPPKARWDSLPDPVRVRLEVGSREASISARQLKAFPAFKTARDPRMVASVEDLDRILTRMGSSKLRVSTEVLEGQSHLSEVPGVVSEAITFASECPQGRDPG